MEELNSDLAALDSEVECYLITDAQEVASKQAVWEELNKEYLEKQAARAAAREEASLVPKSHTPCPMLKASPMLKSHANVPCSTLMPKTPTQVSYPMSHTQCLMPHVLIHP
jgi:hypothetical protein|tara:strand:- start:423 stop:755 length:333 start_codon:yes stop_codon:yes gene_type:complete